MAENNVIPPVLPVTEPELRRTKIDPKGVLQKNLKTFVYLGAALLVIAAALFSSTAKKTPQASAKGQPPQPTLQDNTDNNVQDLKNQLKAERDKEAQQQAEATANSNDPALASATPAQRAAAAAYGPTGVAVPCIPNQANPAQPCQQPGYGPAGYGQPANPQPQLSPKQQQAQLIAAKERERADESRFASNLVYARTQEPQQISGQTPAAQYVPAAQNAQRQEDSSLQAPRAPGDPPEQAGGYKRPMEANIDSASGQPYLVYEGSILDTVLMNRLDGDASGPVKVLVSNPLYSHDHQHVIIPEGTVVLGEAKKIGSAGFGQQRRIAVVFHRLIMPDGYSVDLDQFHGLDQIGEEGLKDKVNNHYFEIFGASIALGVIAGAGEITEGGGTISTSGSQAFTTGTAGSISQSANTMSADSFRLLPKESETTSAWTATKWAETRRGWIFITSRPTMREALRPLISLWIDTLVLRLLNEPMPDQKPVWFVIDELASLQRLPQLHTAITENRKSQNPVILGFQGRSQMEARYGEDSEAMLSQPATKIFLRTTEPRAAKWVPALHLENSRLSSVRKVYRRASSPPPRPSKQSMKSSAVSAKGKARLSRF
jgi:type IV secretion system protein VirB10